MKKLTAITISCVLASAVLLGSGGLTVLADEAPAGGATYYPETFEASEICDYAVNGNKFAFATDKKIAVFDGDAQKYYPVEATALDCCNGEFCYKSTGGIIYDLSGTQLDYEIAETTDRVFDGTYTYVLEDINGGNLKIYDGNENIIEGSFSNLKVYGNVVYAMNGNVLNKITPPETATAINYELADYSSASQIKVGNTVETIEAYNLEKPHFTKLENGEYLTEVKLDAKNFDKTKIKPDGYFQVGSTYKVGENSSFTAGTSALVLCETGNAHIIALNGKNYIKLAKAAAVKDLTEPDFVSAQIGVPADYVYSSPSICDATRLFKVEWSESVKVLGKIAKATSPELVQDFYKIERTDEDGNTLTGYVPCTFVFEKQEVTDDNKTEDPAPSTGNNIRTVVLVFMVIVLVLIALGYITFVITSDKKRKKK